MKERNTNKWNLTAYEPIDMFLSLHETARQTEWDQLLECVDNELQTIIESIGLTASSVISTGEQYLLLKVLRNRPELWAALKSNPDAGADLFSSNTTQIRRVLSDLVSAPDFEVIDSKECWSNRSV